MNEYQILAAYARRFVDLTDEEAGVFVACFENIRVKKREFIIQPGVRVKTRYYVLDGSIRSYVLGEDGSEHTIAFAVTDWWITDYNSYIYQQPATMFVAALEDCNLLRLDYEKEQQLKSQHPKYEKFFRVMAERGLAFQQRRLIANLTLTAEERYDEFVAKYPNIVQQLPQYVLASYLNMTPEFFSKIRKRKMRGKA